MIAFVTSICFLANTLAYGQISLSLGLTPPVAARRPAFSDRPQISIPAEYGSIVQLHFSSMPPGPEHPLFIHIQDAHGDTVAQKNVAAIMKHLQKNLGIDLVLTEAAVGELDAKYLKDKAACDALAREGRMTGADLFLADHGNTLQFTGIEEPALYRQNVRYLKEVLKRQPAIRKWIADKSRRLERDWTRKVNSDLLVLLRLELNRDFKNFLSRKKLAQLNRFSQKLLGRDLRVSREQKEFPNLLRLLRLQEEEGKIDIAKAKKEWKNVQRTAYGVQRLKTETVLQNMEALLFRSTPYAVRRTKANPRFFLERLRSAFSIDLADHPHFMRLTKIRTFQYELEATGLIEEVQRWTDLLLAAAAQTGAEKKAVGQLRDFKRTAKLLKLELTGREWDSFFCHSEPAKRAKNLGGATQILRFAQDDKLSSIFFRAIKFYRAAAARDRAFAKNIRRILRERKQSRVILYTGGFHAEHLKKMCQKSQASYLLIAPRTSGIDWKENDARIFSSLPSEGGGNQGEDSSCVMPLHQSLPPEARNLLSQRVTAGARSLGETFAEGRRFYRGVGGEVEGLWITSPARRDKDFFELKLPPGNFRFVLPELYNSFVESRKKIDAISTDSRNANTASSLGERNGKMRSYFFPRVPEWNSSNRSSNSKNSRFENSSAGLCLNKHRWQALFNASKFLGGIFTRIIPGWPVFIGGLVKSLSWVIRILPSDVASLSTAPFEIPFGDNLASWVSSFKNKIKPRWTFSSTRNRIRLFQQGGLKLVFFEDFGRVMQSGFYMIGSQFGISLTDFLKRSAFFQHFQDKVDHDARSLKAGLPMTNFRIDGDVLFKPVHRYVTQGKGYHTLNLLSRVSPISAASLGTNPYVTLARPDFHEARSRVGRICDFLGDLLEQNGNVGRIVGNLLGPYANEEVFRDMLSGAGMGHTILYPVIYTGWTLSEWERGVRLYSKEEETKLRTVLGEGRQKLEAFLSAEKSYAQSYGEPPVHAQTLLGWIEHLSGSDSYITHESAAFRQATQKIRESILPFYALVEQALIDLNLPDIRTQVRHMVDEALVARAPEDIALDYMPSVFRIRDGVQQDSVTAKNRQFQDHLAMARQAGWPSSFIQRTEIALRELSEYEPALALPHMVYEAIGHRLVEEFGANYDIFRTYKEQRDAEMQNVYSDMLQDVESQGTPRQALRRAMLYAALANMFDKTFPHILEEAARDFGLSLKPDGEINTEQMKQLILESAKQIDGSGQGWVYDDFDALEKALDAHPGGRILYLLDNHGEVVADKLVIRQWLKAGYKVTVAGKHEAIRDDVIWTGAKEFFESDGWFDEYFAGGDITVISSGSTALGTDLTQAAQSPEFLSALRDPKTFMILAKGMGNFYTLFGKRLSLPVFSLALCKQIAAAYEVINAKRSPDQHRQPRKYDVALIYSPADPTLATRRAGGQGASLGHTAVAPWRRNFESARYVAGQMDGIWAPGDEEWKDAFTSASAFISDSNSNPDFTSLSRTLKRFQCTRRSSRAA